MLQQLPPDTKTEFMPIKEALDFKLIFDLHDYKTIVPQL